jgi:selenide,water dikinase
VGFDQSDDAGVYRLTQDLAIVTTADFITPPVDDPFLFGQIAAANALSDVYAMGGRPLTCLNLAAFPARKLPLEVLHRIVAGALDKITEAGAVLAGGHTIEDDEPKFGLAVTGVVHPERIWTNGGARPGDALILTKPLGSGVIFNAQLKGRVSRAALDACLECVTTLNRRAAEILAHFPVHAATDVTGFGLAGHALEMARAAGVSLAFELERLPLMPEALEMYRRGVTTGVNRANFHLVEGHLRFAGHWPAWRREIVFDPQTSGGLLVALDAGETARALEALEAGGVEGACVVGAVRSQGDAVELVFG